jgi:hypothetical protein
MRRTRQRPRNTLANSEAWNTNPNTVNESKDENNQIGMHVRVLRYHEIRLGNIEKQLAKLSRQISSSSSSIKQGTNVKNKFDAVPQNTGKVNPLQDVLKNLAEEVASSNKMIKQFITGDKVGFKKTELKTRQPAKTIIEEKIDETQTMEWKIARARLVRCGMRATDERIRDMVSTMKEEIDLVTDILENHTEDLEKSVEEAVVETEEKNTEDQIKENQSEEDIKSNDSSEDESEEETVDISTSTDIGYVPVHVVVKKKRGRPKKKKNNAK